MVKRIKKDSPGVGPLKVDGRLISDSKEKANVLNEQFKSVFNEKITNDLPDMGHSPFGPMHNFNITVPGITELLKTLKIHKAAGSDGIVPRLLSELSDQLAPPLTIIFNKSIESGIVPEDWRQASVALIFKKGEKYRPSNYRPVSLTCICCKLLEHIVVRSLMEPLENNKILYDWQHGFRSKRSTETQLVTLIHELGENLDNRKQTYITVLNFSKAFDKVYHQLLSIKLDYYGIRGSTIRWINSFLSDRTQKVH